MESQFGDIHPDALALAKLIGAYPREKQREFCNSVAKINPDVAQQLIHLFALDRPDPEPRLSSAEQADAKTTTAVKEHAQQVGWTRHAPTEVKRALRLFDEIALEETLDPAKWSDLDTLHGFTKNALEKEAAMANGGKPLLTFAGDDILYGAPLKVVYCN